MATAAVLKEQGNKAFTAGKFEDAIAFYTKAIDACKEGEEKQLLCILHSNRANAHIKQENFGVALQDGTRAIELDPTFAKGYYRRAAANFALCHFKEALRDFNRVVGLASGDKDARLKRDECDKAARKQAFEEAIHSEREKPFWQEVEEDMPNLHVGKSYTGPTLSRPPKVEEIMAMIEEFKEQKLINSKFAYSVVLDAGKLLRAQQSLVHITIPDGHRITVCGDTHGQFYDLLHIFEINGFPSDANPYLFNGDFVDRGSFSCEVVLTLLAFKACFPNTFFLARGNHETVNMNKVYGFEGEAKQKYGERMVDLMTEVFCALPLAHVINSQIFVVHGGLTARGPDNSDVPSLDEIAAVNRFRQPPEDGGIMSELLWSDPQHELGKSPSKRGVGFSFGPDITKLFLEKNKLKMVIRSHEVKQEGYEIVHGGNLATVFSAPNYMDSLGNQGAFVRFTAPEMKPEYVTFTAAPHPAGVTPMSYASPLMRMGLF